MKLCQKCGQIIAEEIPVCPACGQKVGRGRKFIDDYRIESILHEGHASILCKAVKIGQAAQPVMIRIFTAGSGVDDRVASRLKRELTELQKLPAAYFVAHQQINRSSDGAWYRVSEWVEALNWGELVAGPRLKDMATTFKLFADIASILAILHRRGHFMPHLIMDDIMVSEGEAGDLDVKIDYKLSRFLDPSIARPGPMLKHLIEIHPDIVHGRPLDMRSDIWSLGKVFIETLTADFQADDYSGKIEQLPLPGRVARLFMSMLAEDPDLRPRSMAEVSRILGTVKRKELKSARRRLSFFRQAAEKDLRILKKRQRLLAVILIGVVAVIGIAAFHFKRQMQQDESVFTGYAQAYSGAVAFVLVEYWLSFEDTVLYKNRTEGTAFLVDSKGYLLTNRHVACPWLEDAYFQKMAETLGRQPGLPEFGYRIYLWFEGERAFFKSPAIAGIADLDDIYDLESAYKSDGKPELAIAGVGNPGADHRQASRSSIRDDYAVLKIDPEALKVKPIPLGFGIEAAQIPRLSPVIALGFPLGRRTQGRAVNVSVTRGYVRRSFTDLLQVDSSIHQGSSGGPIIDINGRVIGIASSVASERIPGPLPVVTPLSDIGMVLPISRVIPFLNDLRRGQVKWNGVLDFSIRGKLKKIGDLALAGKWQAAREMAVATLAQNPDPALYMAAGMMSYCTDDFPQARVFFKQVLSVDKNNYYARLMLFLIDWYSGYGAVSSQRLALLRLDWRSSNEFLGFLARIIDGQVKHGPALAGWDNLSEKGWLYYFVGIDVLAAGDINRAQQLMEQAVLATDIDAWGYLMARSKLEKIRRQRQVSMQRVEDRNLYIAENAKVDARINAEYQRKLKSRAALSAVYGQLADSSITTVEKKALMERLATDEPANGELLTGLFFYHAMDRKWVKALEYAGRFLVRPGRESAARLSVGLLRSQILYRIGKKAAAARALQQFCREIKDPWYLLIGKCLLGEFPEKALIQKAQSRPEDLITAHAALGFQAEADMDNAKAMKHYKEALASHLSDWIEYDFARSNLSRLKAEKGR